LVHSRLESLFTRHGATPLSPPLLCPRSTADHYSGGGGALSLAQFMDRSGAIVTLPHDHRVRWPCMYACIHVRVRVCVQMVWILYETLYYINRTASYSDFGSRCSLIANSSSLNVLLWSIISGIVWILTPYHRMWYHHIPSRLPTSVEPPSVRYKPPSLLL
jgi:hypothetical protein